MLTRYEVAATFDTMLTLKWPDEWVGRIIVSGDRRTVFAEFFEHDAGWDYVMAAHYLGDGDAIRFHLTRKNAYMAEPETVFWADPRRDPYALAGLIETFRAL